MTVFKRMVVAVAETTDTTTAQRTRKPVPGRAMAKTQTANEGNQISGNSSKNQ